MGWFRADLLGARVAFTDRRGGVSTPPFDSLNCSFGPDAAPADAAGAVIENRARATRFLDAGLGADDWVPIRQVHGVAVAPGHQARERVEADAVVVTAPGRVAAVLVADCAPIALVGEGGVAAVHAGWRGLRAGVVRAAAESLRAVGVEPTVAVVGPCIRACCYEFGEGDLAPLVAAFGAGVSGRTSSGAPAFDLPAAVDVALSREGVERVHRVGVCTACSPDYFSYRRATAGGDGTTGRQALLAAVPA